MVKLSAFLLVLLFCASANAQIPPYGQTIGSLPQLQSLSGADFAPIVHNGKDYQAPISQISSFLGQPQGIPGSIQFNNSGVFGGSSNFVWNGYAVGIGTPSPQGGTSLDLGSRTDSIILPSGTTAQEPGLPVQGMLRFNTTTGEVEVFSNGAWMGAAGLTIPVAVNFGGTGLTSVGPAGDCLVSTGTALTYAPCGNTPVTPGSFIVTQTQIIIQTQSGVGIVTQQN